MAMFRKAYRAKAKLRLGIAGPSGAGKTYSALLIASGLASWDKIAVIDTENGSADLYAHLGDYSVLTLQPPYSPEKYIDAIKAAENEGFEVVIIDSLTHAWAGEGGILDQQGKATDTKYKGNSFSAWREFTPKHNALVEAMLKSKCHVIATLRSKTDYVQVTENGKTVIKKVGMAPIQRDGMEYEFTLFFDISPEHVATASKDRTSMFDGQYFTPSSETGKKLLSWLENCTETPAQKGTAQQATTSDQQPSKTDIKKRHPVDMIIGLQKQLSMSNDDLKFITRQVIGGSTLKNRSSEEYQKLLMTMKEIIEKGIPWREWKAQREQDNADIS